MVKLSVVLAVRNEEANLARCLESVKEIASEIVVVDEHSTDRTVEIARSYGAKVYETEHEPIFHLTKQKALDQATGDWILQLDADEVVTAALAREIGKVLRMTNEELRERLKSEYESKKYRLFMRHQRLLEKRDPPVGEASGRVGKSGEVAAFFIPRRNIFLGKSLLHAGVYPDAAIRLIKNGKAHFPAKSVHEQMEVDGEVSWLFNDLEHHDSPTLSRYFDRLNRYTDLHAMDLNSGKVGKNLWNLFLYTTVKPIFVFLKLFVRHKGFMDGMRGFLWSVLSASHYPIAYYKYYTGGYNN